MNMKKIGVADRFFNAQNQAPASVHNDWLPHPAAWLDAAPAETHPQETDRAGNH
ncbi:hypothetical protein [Achromobacter sp. MYb9]|uniref:hypothetical protein n=1 Tax=Achromobacter sp. MYb9 TaxID=1827284 RepID=UPI001304C52D|nr:hypothetical protein [Achromobacter sp. MYb9]